MQLFGSEFQVPYGDVGAITLMAHIKRRQQHEFGYRDEHYGQIAVTWRQHAQLNPEAQMRKPMSLDDYLASRWVVEPLRLFDCCPSTDGGGACVVTSLERARDLAQAAGPHPRRRAIARVGNHPPGRPRPGRGWGGSQSGRPRLSHGGRDAAAISTWRNCTTRSPRASSTTWWRGASARPAGRRRLHRRRQPRPHAAPCHQTRPAA